MSQQVGQNINASSFELRTGTDAEDEVRPFGGVNLLTFGDLWQLAPVGGASIASHPLRGAALDPKCHTMSMMFWPRSKNSIQKVRTCVDTNGVCTSTLILIILATAALTRS